MTSRQVRRAEERERAKAEKTKPVDRETSATGVEILKFTGGATNTTRASEKVVLVNISGSEVSTRFYRSMLNSFVYDAQNNHRIVGHIPVSSGANIVSARNSTVTNFLETFGQSSGNAVDWYLTIDSDMEWEPDAIERLIMAAHPKDRPIVGGLCFALKKGQEHEILPTVYGFSKDDPPKLLQFVTYPPDDIFQVAGTGTGFLLIHRTVLEKLQTLHKKPWPWFAETIWGDDSIGEDLTFCMRAQQAGFPVHVDSRVKIGHVKPFVIDEAMYVEHIYMQSLKDKGVKFTVSEAGESIPTFVVIPIKDKLELTKGILDQLKEQGGSVAVFVIDNGSGPETKEFLADQRGATVIEMPGAGWAEMINRGWKEAELRSDGKPYNLAVLNNDLILGPKFLPGLHDAVRSNPQILLACPNYDGRTATTDLVQVQSTFKDAGVSGFAFMVKGEIASAGFGMLDEKFHWYGADDDLVMRIAEFGGVCVMAINTAVEHIGGGSMTSRDDEHGNQTNERLGTQELKDQCERDMEYLVAKWSTPQPEVVDLEDVAVPNVTAPDEEPDLVGAAAKLSVDVPDISWNLDLEVPE